MEENQKSDGFCSGLKTVHRTVLPRLRRDRPFESHHSIQKRKAHPLGGLSFLCELDTIDISSILQSCDHDRFLPTPVPGAFRTRWILPRPKNMPPACFLNGLSNPITASKKESPPSGWTFLFGRSGGIRIGAFSSCCFQLFGFRAIPFHFVPD